jgi:hypothetical protein
MQIKRRPNRWTRAAGDVRVVQLTFTFGRVESGKSAPEFTTTFMPPSKVELIWNSTAY